MSDLTKLAELISHDDTRVFKCGETGGIFIPVFCDEDAAHDQ
jgi:hypothetical protein